MPQNPTPSFFFVKVNTWKRHHSVFYVHISPPYCFRRTRFYVDLFEYEDVVGVEDWVVGVEKVVLGIKEETVTSKSS